MGAQPWPDAKSAECFRLLLDGFSYGEIAVRLGITRSAVSGYVDRHGGAQVVRESKRIRPPRILSVNNPRSGTYAFEVPKARENDDRLHLTMLLAALREARAA